MVTSAPRSPRPGRLLRGPGWRALFSVQTLPHGRAWRPPLVSGWPRGGLGGRGLFLGELLFSLPTTDSVWLLFFRGLQWGGWRFSIGPLANLRIAGFSQFLEKTQFWDYMQNITSQWQRVKIPLSYSKGNTHFQLQPKFHIQKHF